MPAVATDPSGCSGCPAQSWGSSRKYGLVPTAREKHCTAPSSHNTENLRALGSSLVMPGSARARTKRRTRSLNALNWAAWPGSSERIIHLKLTQLLVNFDTKGFGKL